MPPPVPTLFKVARRRLWLIVLFTVPLWLAACATPMARGTDPVKPKVDHLADLVRPGNVQGLDDESDNDKPFAARDDLIPSAIEESDPLPKHTVARLSFNNTPLQDVLQAVVADAHLALAVVWDSPDSKVNRSTVSMSQLGGDLTSVLNKLAESYGFYWQYKDGMLHIAADRQYVAPIPPIADLFESLPIMVKTLGGTDVFLDRSARMITFRASSQSFSKIRNYLEMTRRNRALIVYDTYLWEVTLNDSSRMGIDWGALAGAAPATAISAGAAAPAVQNSFTAGLVNGANGGTGLAVNLATTGLSVNMLLDFLRSQGTINSLSQPKIQLLAGGKATLKDEIATTYVSRVGSSSISAGTVIPGAVETSEVKTGVTLDVSGDVSDGTIYSDISLRISDLIAMDSAIVSGTTITLPKTSSRELHTHVRAKQGDTILLAGIQYDKKSSSSASALGVERSNQADVSRYELIIILKPRIKRFITRTVAEASTPSTPSSVAPESAAPQTQQETRPQALSPATSPSPTIQAPAPVAEAPPGYQKPEAKVEMVPAVYRPQPQPIRAPDAAGSFYVQLAAFAIKTNAENLRQDLNQSLDAIPELTSNIQVSAISTARDGTSFRVLAGPFESRILARQWTDRAQSVVGTHTLVLQR